VLAAGLPGCQREASAHHVDAVRPAPAPQEQKELERLRAQDQREIKRLKQELRRKEKVLAEAAALLIASEKIQAFWGEGGDD
jgi:transposase